MTKIVAPPGEVTLISRYTYLKQAQDSLHLALRQIDAASRGSVTESYGVRVEEARHDIAVALDIVTDYVLTYEELSQFRLGSPLLDGLGARDDV